jgi:hypothetical protein
LGLGYDECRGLFDAVGAEPAPGLQDSAVPTADCDDRRLAVSEALDEVEGVLILGDINGLVATPSFLSFL